MMRDTKQEAAMEDPLATAEVVSFLDKKILSLKGETARLTRAEQGAAAMINNQKPRGVSKCTIGHVAIWGMDLRWAQVRGSSA